MSFAVSAASGYTCQFGSHAKPLQAGFAARAGVEAACLASSGLHGQSHVLDHPRGMAALMGGGVPERLEETMEKLGRGYALAEHGLVLKPWPSCGYTHRIMTCALRLRSFVALDSIEAIDLHLPDFHAAVLRFAQPMNRSEALFSAPFVAAMGLVHGDLRLSDLERRRWDEPPIFDLISRTRVHAFAPARPELNYSEEDPDRMVLTLADGHRLEEICVHPLGAPQAPMSAEQLWSKFESNAGDVRENRAARFGNWLNEACVTGLFLEQGTIS